MELGWVKKNKISLIFIAILFICIILGWAAYSLFGHQIIKVVYEGRLMGILDSNKIMEGGDKYPLEHFLDKADWIFSEVITLVFALSLLFVIFFIFLKSTNDKYKKPTPIEWFYLVGGLFLIQWYFFWMDDAFIFFRYIDNLLFLKIGLVYNQGEYVEGISSPFWTLFLTLFRATGLSYWVIIRLLSIANFVLFWFILVQVNRNLSPSSDKAVINFPLAYLAFNYGVLCFFSSGMETTFVQILGVVYALYILNPSPMILQFLLAISPLVRPELVIPFAICAAWSWLYQKKFPFRMILMGVIFNGLWLIFRIYYYADLFPNTFYLKDMIDVRQGLVYVHDTLNAYHFYTVTLLLVLLIILLNRRGIHLELSKRLIMVLTAAPVVLYVIKIGGDFAHYRYLAFPFILTVCAFSGIIENFIHTFHLNKYRLLTPLIGIAVPLVVFSFYPRQLDRHPLFINAQNAKATQVGKIYDVAQGNKRQELYPSYLDWGARINIDIMREYRKSHKEFRYEDTIEAAGCRLSYVRFNKRIIHRLGLTDAILARTEMEADLAMAHKLGLRPLGDDLITLYKSSEYIGKGMYRKAVEEGRAPEWIRKNLETIEIIERKIYNNHNFWENLRLAFTSPPKIKP